MEQLVLNYPRGRMVFNVEKYFPCKLNVARKVFPLIGKWATEEDFDALWDYLTDRYAEYGYEARDFRLCAEEARLKENDRMFSYYNARAKESENLRKRTKRNIELLMGGRQI
jgi:vacuolar-type H+-ATPase subunit B/Vma2